MFALLKDLGTAEGPASLWSYQYGAAWQDVKCGLWREFNMGKNIGHCQQL
jgi:hypothetical protein